VRSWRFSTGTPVQDGPLGVQDDVLVEVEDLLQLGGGEVQEGADLGGHVLDEPDVGGGGGQLNVAHAVAANDALGDLHPAPLADLALKALALVLAAGALVVLDGTEDALVKEPVPLGLQGAVVDGLGLLHLPVAPGADLLGGGQGDADLADFLFHLSSRKRAHLLEARPSKMSTGLSFSSRVCTSRARA